MQPFFVNGSDAGRFQSFGTFPAEKLMLKIQASRPQMEELQPFSIVAEIHLGQLRYEVLMIE